LSFEIQAKRQRELDAALEEANAERRAWLLRRKQQEEANALWRKQQAEKEQWRKDNPELAAAEEAALQAERQAQRERLEAKRLKEQQEREMEERRTRIRATVYHEGPQALSEEQFLDWLEFASPDELECFDADCLRRTKPGPAFFQGFSFISDIIDAF
jgi:hypothetical protein